MANKCNSAEDINCVIIDDENLISEEEYNYPQQERRMKNNNNSSVMTNFNPMTALETYENNLECYSNSYM